MHCLLAAQVQVRVPLGSRQCLRNERMTARIVRLLDRRPGEDRLPIVKGIPLPAKNGARASKLRATLRAMEVGDSFLARSTGAVFRFAKQLGITVTIRVSPGGGWRVWRIK